MKLLSLIAAESVIRDINTDSVSLINILESIEVTGFPISIYKIAVYAVFMREDENLTNVFSGSLTLYNNETVIEKKEINFSIPKARIRMISRFQGLVLSEVGVLRVQIEIPGKIDQAVIIPIIKKDTSPINKD